MLGALLKMRANRCRYERHPGVWTFAASSHITIVARHRSALSISGIFWQQALASVHNGLQLWDLRKEPVMLDRSWEGRSPCRPTYIPKKRGKEWDDLLPS